MGMAGTGATLLLLSFKQDHLMAAGELLDLVNIGIGFAAYAALFALVVCIFGQRVQEETN